MKTDFPSYVYQVVCKATTLCENWAGPNPEHPLFSQNHFMLGDAEEWFYRCLAGIRVDASEEQCIQIFCIGYAAAMAQGQNYMEIMAKRFLGLVNILTAESRNSGQR